MNEDGDWMPEVGDTVYYSTWEWDFLRGTVAEVEPNWPQVQLAETGLWYELRDIQPTEVP